MKILLPVLLLLCSFTVRAQEKDPNQYYLFKDANFSNGTTDVKAGKYLLIIRKETDTSFAYLYYKTYGPLIKVERYLDEDGTKPCGKWCYYDAKGRLDSIGKVLAGKREGDWYFYNDTMGVDRRVDYELGKRKKEFNYSAKQIVYRDGSTSPIPQYQPDTTEVLVEAMFEGGIPAFTKHLQRNLKVPDRMLNVMDVGKYTVRVDFSIFKDGQVGDIDVSQSVEFSADQEAIRMIVTAGKWKPATVNGRTVVYRYRQPISLVITEE